MKKNVTALAALALLAAQTGEPAAALSLSATQQHQLCTMFGEVTDRNVLQQELAVMLETDPTNTCIDFLVDRLGGTPFARLSFVEEGIDAY